MLANHGFVGWVNRHGASFWAGCTPWSTSGSRQSFTNDADQLLSLWDLLFADTDPPTAPVWKEHAHDWFAHHVDDRTSTRLPVIDVQGSIVATAISTVELGVPNPHCPPGRAVRLANVFTVPGH